ncbi:hypothetical protein [Natranaerobius thermophilus]
MVKTLLENLSLLKERYRESDVVSGIDTDGHEKDRTVRRTYGNLW